MQNWCIQTVLIFFLKSVTFNFYFHLLHHCLLNFVELLIIVMNIIKSFLVQFRFWPQNSEIIPLLVLQLSYGTQLSLQVRVDSNWQAWTDSADGNDDFLQACSANFDDLPILYVATQVDFKINGQVSYYFHWIWLGSKRHLFTRMFDFMTSSKFLIPSSTCNSGWSSFASDFGSTIHKGTIIILKWRHAFCDAFYLQNIDQIDLWQIFNAQACSLKIECWLLSTIFL